MDNKLAYKIFEEKLKGIEQENLILKKEIEKLKREGKKFRTITNTAIDSIFCKDIERKYTYVNPHMTKLFGCDETDLIGKVPEEIFNEESAAIISEMDQRTFSGENVSEIRTLEIEGEIYTFHTIQVPIRDTDNNIIGINGIVRDITESKKMEDDLKKEKEKSENYLQLAGVMFIGLDTNGHINLANKKACDILECTESEVMGKNWFDNFIPLKDRENVRLVFNELVSGNIEPVEYHENEIITNNGNTKIIAWHNSIIRDDNGKITGVLSSGEDHTIRKKLEDQILQSQKLEAISTLAGGIAHDFNNMLGIITGNISYGLSFVNEGDELFDVLSDIQEGAKQAQSLTQQLLTFSKGGEPIKKAVDFNAILKESSIFNTRGAKARCEFDLQDDLWTLEVDKGQMNQVISNLIINALQAMPDGGTIKIRTNNTEVKTDSRLPVPPGNYVKTVIEDRGVGISKENLTQIFDPFFTTKQEGNGLGLTTTYSIINKHGGRIMVKSLLNIGTTFTLYLPVSDKTNFQIERKKIMVYQGAGKILIMDDNDSILKIAGKILNKIGYETVLSTDGAEAIDIYKKAYHSQNPFDLVILDLTVPGGMGGATAMKQLLQINPEVKAVVSSGYSNNPIMSNYEDYGFCDVIPKPYKMAQIAEILNNILKKDI